LTLKQTDVWALGWLAPSGPAKVGIQAVFCGPTRACITWTFNKRYIPEGDCSRLEEIT